MDAQVQVEKLIWNVFSLIRMTVFGMNLTIFLVIVLLLIYTNAAAVEEFAPDYESASSFRVKRQWGYGGWGWGWRRPWRYYGWGYPMMYGWG
ncbi:unnamed protein product [Strongylus vulgaris]|uniref:Uncharacterized protein n=1 Tax=Strongylus vulgaris TaxID=40348 RepID=A0A3P7KN39_STRVU|nr:unnamed protein product [Strongylus vulgaris]